ALARQSSRRSDAGEQPARADLANRALADLGLEPARLSIARGRGALRTDGARVRAAAATAGERDAQDGAIAAPVGASADRAAAGARAGPARGNLRGAKPRPEIDRHRHDRAAQGRA